MNDIRKLIMYSDSNPGVIYSSIEFPTWGAMEESLGCGKSTFVGLFVKIVSSGIVGICDI